MAVGAVERLYDSGVFCEDEDDTHYKAGQGEDGRTAGGDEGGRCVMIVLKKVTAIPTLMRWRAEVIRNVFGVEPHPRLLVANRRYYRTHMADGTHLAFVAEFDGVDCGCGAVCFTDELPSPDNPTGRCAYLMNIYVREDFRNRGIAHQIVGKLIDESRRRCCGKIYLETTVDGKSLYLSSGFTEMPDMMKYYDSEN